MYYKINYKKIIINLTNAVKSIYIQNSVKIIKKKSLYLYGYLTETNFNL